MAGGQNKRVSCGLDFTSPQDITEALKIATENKYISEKKIFVI